jgi:hypothetical protein
MPTMWERAPDGVITTYLGQFDRASANWIAGRLEDAGIVWWYKEPGLISVVWEIGVRLYVDETKLDQAKAIAEQFRIGQPDEGPAAVPPDE